jgi:deoxyribodipyrimidine photolyase
MIHPARIDNFPGANLRHYHFMLGGIAETSRALEKRGIRMVVWKGDPAAGIFGFAKNAAIAVTDCGYLRKRRTPPRSHLTTNTILTEEIQRSSPARHGVSANTTGPGVNEPCSGKVAA